MNSIRHVRQCPACGHGLVLVASECPACNEVKPGMECRSVQAASAPSKPLLDAVLRATSGRLVMLGIAALGLAFAALE